MNHYVLYVGSRISLRLVLSAGMLAGAIGVAQPLSPSQAPIPQIEEALRSAKFAQASALCARALKTTPHDVRLWTLRGMAYAGSGDLQQAVASYNRALELRRDYLPALEGAAQVEFQRDSPNAEPLLQHLLVLRPDDPTTHAMLGSLEARRNECDRAVEHFVRALPAINGQAAALSRFGVCLAQQNKSAEAIQAFQSAAALQPNDVSARYNLALALWQAKRHEDAAQELQPLLVAGTTNEDILTLAADIDEARNDTPHAVAMLNRAIQANPREVKGYLWLANLASNHASYKVGIDVLDAGIRILPKAGQLRLARGILHAQSGEFESASEDFEAAHELDPRLSFAGTAEGIIASQRHDSSASIARFRQQVREHPESAFDHYLLAESLRQNGADAGTPQLSEALHEARRAVALDPSLVIARDLLADLYLSAGDAAQAADQCQAALKNNPDNQEALYRLILALRKSDRRQEVPALTRRLVELRDAEKAKQSHVRTFELSDNLQPPGRSANAGSGPGPQP